MLVLNPNAVVKMAAPARDMSKIGRAPNLSAALPHSMTVKYKQLVPLYYNFTDGT